MQGRRIADLDWLDCEGRQLGRDCAQFAGPEAAEAILFKQVDDSVDGAVIVADNADGVVNDLEQESFLRQVFCSHSVFSGKAVVADKDSVVKDVVVGDDAQLAVFDAEGLRVAIIDDWQRRLAGGEHFRLQKFSSALSSDVLAFIAFCRNDDGGAGAAVFSQQHWRARQFLTDAVVFQFAIDTRRADRRNGHGRAKGLVVPDVDLFILGRQTDAQGEKEQQGEGYGFRHGCHSR